MRLQTTRLYTLEASEQEMMIISEAVYLLSHRVPVDDRSAEWWKSLNGVLAHTELYRPSLLGEEGTPYVSETDLKGPFGFCARCGKDKESDFTYVHEGCLAQK